MKPETELSIVGVLLIAIAFTAWIIMWHLGALHVMAKMSICFVGGGGFVLLLIRAWSYLDRRV